MDKHEELLAQLDKAMQSEPGLAPVVEAAIGVVEELKTLTDKNQYAAAINQMGLCLLANTIAAAQGKLSAGRAVSALMAQASLIAGQEIRINELESEVASLRRIIEGKPEPPARFSEPDAY